MLFTAVRTIRQLAFEALDFALPTCCAACRAPIAGRDAALCFACRDDLERPDADYCGRCGRTVHPDSRFDRGCGRCHREAHWNVAGIVRAGAYGRETLRRLVLRAKYSRDERAGALLAERLAVALQLAPWRSEIDMLVPVPMHWLRRCQRPCDHARELARILGRRVGRPARSAVVRRRVYSPSQTHATSFGKRFENVRDCFAASRARAVAGATVCIVDNLLVSGATVHEVSRVLRRAGAARVYCAVAARDMPPGDVSPSGGVEGLRSPEAIRE